MTVAPYIPHATQDFICADLTDYYPPAITSLTVQACLVPPDTDPTGPDWQTATWHPDKAATIAYEYPGDLAEGWYFLWSRVNNGQMYRHGRVRLI